VDPPPAQIRVKLGLDYPILVPGDRVRLKATLSPPSRPVAPGSYDFRRDLFFDRIGAVGFGYGRIGVTPATDSESALMRAVWIGFAELRALIEGRILERYEIRLDSQSSGSSLRIRRVRSRAGSVRLHGRQCLGIWRRLFAAGA